MTRLLAAGAVAGLVGGLLLTTAAAAPASTAAAATATAAVSTATTVPADDAATVRLAAPVSPAAPDTRVPATTITIPLTIANTSNETLYDVGVSSLRSAPITTNAELDKAFGGDAIEESEFTTRGPRQEVTGPLAPGASRRVDYVVDSGSEDTGICLCVVGVYALDVLVTGADEQGGQSVTVARTQTYLPSLGADVTAPSGVGWLWPLLDRPHRLAAGAVFADDDLAASVAAGGRLDRALRAVESVDAADARQPGVSRSVLLLLDPEILDELVTMTRSYRIEAADGSTTTGTGGPAAAAWLARLAAVVPLHDVRMTAPADPDVVGLAARGIAVQTTPDTATAEEVATALGRPDAALPAHDLAWPVGPGLDAAGLAALTGNGATGLIRAADTDDDGAVAAVGTGTDATGATPVLLADPALTRQADDAIGVQDDTSPALQRLVVSAALTSVTHPDDARFVFVVPDRDVDVDAGAAARAILATTSLGPPTSPLAALSTATTSTTRSDLLTPTAGPTPDPLPAALDVAATATQAAATIREAVVSGADTVVGDLPSRVQRVASSSWVGDDDGAARATADLATRAASLMNGVQVVVRTTGSYNLASADAPLVLTVANNLSVPVRVRVDVQATTRANGFRAGSDATVTIAANSRPTLRVPTTVTRSGSFDVSVTLRTTDGAAIGAPAQITVTSTAVGVVGQIVTYSAGALLVLALLGRGVRRLLTRSRAGSDAPGPDDDTPRPDGTRPEGQSTVPANRT